MNNQQGELLIIVARDGKYEVVQELLRNKVDIDYQDWCYGDTALMKASKNGHTAIVKLLIDNNVDINIQDNWRGRTALMKASENGHTAIVKLLIDNNADINIQDDFGKTALMLASENGRKLVVKLLLDSNVDINIKDDYGWTALMWASNNGNTAIVKLLIDKNADINIKNNDGRTALDLAKNKEIEKIFKNYIVEIEEKEEVDKLKNKNKLNFHYKGGFTALMKATMKGRVSFVKLLIDNNADINIQANYGNTALILASLYGHTAIVKLLIDKNADINIKNNDGRTALDLAKNKEIEKIFKNYIVEIEEKEEVDEDIIIEYEKELLESYKKINNLKKLEIENKELLEEKDLSLCIICMDRKRSVVFLPCRHCVTCKECYDQLYPKECPMDRKRIKRTIKPYYS